jgi:YbgC/YbaW family acyl-CoA thioester hydrolase
VSGGGVDATGTGGPPADGARAGADGLGAFGRGGRRREDFRRLHRLRVRWAEVDLQGIVFNGHYLLYLDTALAEHWRAMALPYVDALRRLGGDLFVRHAALDYRAPARFDDLLEVGIRCEGVGTSSITFGGALFRHERALVEGRLVYVYADPATLAPRPVPPALRELLSGYEVGEPMFEVRTGDWAALGEDARALRTEVFAGEQGIPAGMLCDAADPAALHAVAYNRLGMPLATGRLVERGGGVGQIGRMAVRQPMRGGGVGRALLSALHEAAAARGCRELMLQAEASAAGFYARAGYAARGPAFQQAGITHIEMVWAPRSGQHPPPEDPPT